MLSIKNYFSGVSKIFTYILALLALVLLLVSITVQSTPLAEADVIQEADPGVGSCDGSACGSDCGSCASACASGSGGCSGGDN